MNPIGLAVLAVTAAVAGLVAVWRNWDQITEIVERLYTACREWLQEKLGAVFDWLGGKIESVVGFFRGAYDRIVGNSIVPDMVFGIEEWMSRLGETMPTLAEDAATRTADAMEDSAKRSVLAWGTASNQIGGALRSITGVMDSEGGKQIGVQKGVSAALAAINIAEGITKAMALPFPKNWIEAARVAASGAAQLRAIRGASRGGGSSPSLSGGGSSAPMAPASSPPATSRTLFISGVSPNQFYSGDAVRELFAAMNEHIKDGGRLVVA